MLYTVECNFDDPMQENEWNEFYTNVKLPALISVSGFKTSQRFKAVSPGCPVYLAIHTVTDPAVLSSTEYRQKGGGNFARWQAYISDWRRNLYEGLSDAPEVHPHERLILSSTEPVPLADLGLDMRKISAVCLDRNPTPRWIGTATATSLAELSEIPKGTYAYAPMTPQKFQR